MSDIEDKSNYSSDGEVNPQEHKKLLQAVSQIGKTQYIRKPTRSEPILSQNEFNLVKNTSEFGGKVRESAISVNDLVKVLNKTSKHRNVGKELKNSKRNKRILPKPLDKPVAERIHRTIGYEKLKKDLSKWDAVVTRNRVSEQQVFPLHYEEILVDIKENKKPPDVKIKSEFRRKFEALEAELKGKSEEQLNEKDEEREKAEKLTKEELIQRRRKLAYLKIRESQKSAKARYQKKIKSKKYHKLLKREKLKEQIKEFEQLQKIDPEAALEKLEKIEKNRVLERASLRHKNTGTWAKNLQVRAKYDKDVRKDLAEQIAISRELTAKSKDDDESDDDADDDNEVYDEGNVDPFNPWVKTKSKTEVAEFVSGYRKYWLERNKNELKMDEFKSSNQMGDKKKDVSDAIESNENMSNGSETDLNGSEENIAASNFVKVIQDENKLREKGAKPQQHLKKERSKGTIKQKSGVKKDKMKFECGWVIEENPVPASNDTNKFNNKDIDDIFDEAEDLVQEKVAQKFQKLSQNFQPKSKKKSFSNFESNKNGYLDLSFKQKNTRPDFDEELLETPTKVTDDKVQEDILGVSKPLNIEASEKSPDKHVDIFDPEKFTTVKAKTFATDFSEMISTGEFLDDGDQADDADKGFVFAHAFEDGDVEADFEKEREEERKKNTAEEVDLTLPGWGSWAGCGLSKAKQRKRLVLKFPKEEKRRDENKERVYINENVSKKLKQHLVCDLPFPFTSVKDYEASIRAPIGPEFVPETAFRMLTRPAVITKMGQVIDPMDKDILVKPPKRPRNVVDARIEKLNKRNKK